MLAPLDREGRAYFLCRAGGTGQLRSIGALGRRPVSPLRVCAVWLERTPIRRRRLSNVIPYSVPSEGKRWVSGPVTGCCRTYGVFVRLCKEGVSRWWCGWAEDGDNLNRGTEEEATRERSRRLPKGP